MTSSADPRSIPRTTTATRNTDHIVATPAAHDSEARANACLPDALDPKIGVLRSVLGEIGADRIRLATLARGWVCLQPVRLDDGERIARMLGCTTPLDHRHLVPGHTLWTGIRDGIEVQVRSTLREPTRTAR